MSLAAAAAAIYAHLLGRILNLVRQLPQQLAAPSSARLVLLPPPLLLSIVSAAGTARQHEPAACSTPDLALVMTDTAFYLGKSDWHSWVMSM